MNTVLDYAVENGVESFFEPCLDIASTALYKASELVAQASPSERQELLSLNRGFSESVAIFVSLLEHHDPSVSEKSASSLQLCAQLFDEVCSELAQLPSGDSATESALDVFAGVLGQREELTSETTKRVCLFVLPSTCVDTDPVHTLTFVLCGAFCGAFLLASLLASLLAFSLSLSCSCPYSLKHVQVWHRPCDFPPPPLCSSTLCACLPLAACPEGHLEAANLRPHTRTLCPLLFTSVGASQGSVCPITHTCTPSLQPPGPCL